MLKEEIDLEEFETDLEDEKSPLNQLAKQFADEILARPEIRGLYISNFELMSFLHANHRPDANEQVFFPLRVKYLLQRGWTHMVRDYKGGLQILTNAERAEEARRRTRLGQRKVERAARAIAATDTNGFTRAQLEAHDAAELYVSRRAAALRAAQRQK